MNRKAIERACLIEIDFTVGEWYKRYCAEIGKKLRIGKSKDAVVERVDYDMSLVVDEHNNIITEEKVVRDSGMIQTESVTAEETVKDLGVIEQPMPQMVYQQPPMQYAYQAPAPQLNEVSVAKEADGVLVCCFLEDDINKHKDFIERCFEIGVTKVIFYISNTDLNITKAIHAYMKDNFISFEFRAHELSKEEVFSKAYENIVQPMRGLLSLMLTIYYRSMRSMRISTCFLKTNVITNMTVSRCLSKVTNLFSRVL